MADKKLQYIIRMIADDSKIRQQMKNWDWADIMGTAGKSFGDMIADEAKYGADEVKNAFKELKVDWTQILGADEIEQLEQALARSLQKNKDAIKHFANEKNADGIKNTIDLMVKLGEEFKAIGSNFDAGQIARSLGSFVTALQTDKIAKFVTDTETVVNTLNKLFSGKRVSGAGQSIEKIATAMASIGVDKSKITSIERAREEMEKIPKKAEIVLDIKYDSLSTDDLLQALRTKHGKPKLDLATLMDFEFSDLTQILPELKHRESIIKQMYSIIQLEERAKKELGRTLVNEYFEEDTGYESMRDLKESFNEMTKVAKKGVQDTVEQLEQGVKTIQQSITKKIGELSAVKINLTLDEADKIKFKNSIDAFVSDLNSQKYGEFNKVSVDLELNEPKKTSKRGRPKTTSIEQIEGTKADIQKALDVTKVEYDKVDKVLADLNEKHKKELEKNENYDNEPQSARLKGSIARAQEELGALKKTMTSYEYLLSHMDDGEFAKHVISDWKRFSSATQSIIASQDDLLTRTRNWRNEMNAALRFNYKWSVDNTADEYDKLAWSFAEISENNPLKLTPDIDYLVNAIEQGLSGREIKVKLAADGAITTNGVVSNFGMISMAPPNGRSIVPAIASNVDSAFSSATSKPKPVVESPTLREDKPKSHTYVDADIDGIIKFVEDQIENRKKINQQYAELLKDAGVTDREVSAYIQNVRNKSAEVPKEIIEKYGSEDIFLKRLKKTKEEFNLNEKLPFFNVTEDILKLKKVINDNPNDEAKVKNASEQIKSLLISSIVDSFKNYFQTTEEQKKSNTKEIEKQQRIRAAALAKYNSDDEKQKRRQIISAKQQKIAELESNTAIKEYTELLQLIEEAQAIGDEASRRSFSEQERKTLPAVKQGYQELIRLKDQLQNDNLFQIVELEQKIAQLEAKTDKSKRDLQSLDKFKTRLTVLQYANDTDPNLIAARKAQDIINERTKRNENIDIRREGYEPLFSLKGLKGLIDSNNTRGIYEFVINEILAKSDITDRMSVGRKSSSSPDAIKLFETTAQQLITTTIGMVQQALGVAQKATEELDRRAANESLLGDVRKIATKKGLLSSLYGVGIQPLSQEVFAQIETIFGEDLERARQITVGAFDKKTEDGRIVKYIPDKRETAYINFAEALKRATEAADGFRGIYDSWSLEDRVSFVASQNKEEWFNQKYNDPAVASKNYSAYVESELAHKALEESISAKVKQKDGSSREQYGIYDEFARQLKGYVFRVVLVDEKGTHTIGVGTQSLVKRGELAEPDKSYSAGSANMANFLKALPEDLSELADIKFYNIPGGKGRLDKPSNVETPRKQEKNNSPNNAREVANAKRIIGLSNQLKEQTSTTMTTEEVLATTSQALTAAEQAVEAVKGQVGSITNGADIEEYRKELIKKRNELKKSKNNKVQSAPELLSNEIFDEADKMIQDAISEKYIVKHIANDPLNIKQQELFEGDLPDSFKRLSEVIQQQEVLRNTLPASQEEAVRLQKQIQELSSEENTLRQEINQWANEIISKKDDIINSANEKKAQAAPKLAKDTQKRLVDLVNEAMSLSEKIEADPNNKELKIQMQGIVDTISRLVVLYKDLLSEYNITTKGFLGNESQVKKNTAYENALNLYNNPTEQNLAYMRLFSDLSIPNSIEKMVELYKQDRELMAKEAELLHSESEATEEQKKIIQAERMKIREDRAKVSAAYTKEREKALQWVNKYKDVDDGIFAGLSSGGKKSKIAQDVVLNWLNNMHPQVGQVVGTDQEEKELNDKISQLYSLKEQEDEATRVRDRKKEIVDLVERQLAIEQEIAGVNTTIERKAELEAEHKRNQVRMSELGVQTAKYATTSVDPNELREAYLTVVEDLYNKQAESDAKIARLHSEIANQTKRLGYLQADRTMDMVFEDKWYHNQDDVITKAIAQKATDLANANPQLYNAIREVAEEDVADKLEWEGNESRESYERRLENTINRKAQELAIKFLSGTLSKDLKDAVLSGVENPEDFTKEIVTPEQKQGFVNEAIRLQQQAIAEKEQELVAEIVHNHEIVAERDRYKSEGQITDEMLVARKNATEEIRREARIVHESAGVVSQTITARQEATYTPLTANDDDNDYASRDTHYQNYTSGQTYQYGAGAYSINVPGVATEDTLWKIYQLLSGDTSERGLSDAERREKEAELETIRQSRGDGSLGRNEPQYGTPEREIFERRNRLASDLGRDYLDFADVKYTDIDSTVTEILRDVASSIFKRINKSGLELSEIDKINELQQKYTQMEGADVTPELGKQLYDLINRVFIHIGNSGIDIENSSFVQEKKKIWNAPTETKDHLYNQFADWLRQIAKEVFNITDLPIDKFKDVIQNIWIPEALKNGVGDIFQLDMNKASGVSLIENRLGVRRPEIYQMDENEAFRKYLLGELDEKTLSYITARYMSGVKKQETESEFVPDTTVEESKEVSESLMTIGKAITIINKAIGSSTAKTPSGMAKAYANKIHGNAEAVEAAKLLYNTPDSDLTSMYGKNTKEKLKAFRDAWASKQTNEQERFKAMQELENQQWDDKIKNSTYKQAVETVRNAIGDFKGRSDTKKAEKYNSLGQEVKEAGNIIYNNLSNATKEEKILFEKLKRLRDAAQKINKQVITPSTDTTQVDDNIMHMTLPDGSPWEGTKQEWDEFNAWLSGESVEVDVKPIVQPEALDQAIDEAIANNPPETTIVKADFADGTHFEGSEAELQEMIAMFGEPISKMIEDSNQQLENKQKETVESTKQVENAQSETVESGQQLNNIEALKAREAELIAELAADDKIKAAQSAEKTSSGIIGAMNELAKDNTLHQILEAIGEIAKRQVSSVSGKGNSAQDLLLRLQKMFEIGADQKKERVAYIDLATGAMTDSIEGTSNIIDSATFNALRKAYQDSVNFNAQVHTHADADDPYFSPKDLQQFANDAQNGITKQILLSKNNMTVLDMANVSDVGGLLDALAKTEHNFEALATTAEKFGATYVSSTFGDMTPQGLVKMLGIKGIESKYTEAETRESARQSVLKEDAKEAADMLQESTGRAIKKTVERVGLELETLTEKTDAKGNKTWTSQINNKFGKAMKATNKDIEAQELDKQFGVGTKAATALTEYREQYAKLTTLVDQFNRSTSDEEKTGLQKQINDLIPVFNKAEKELVNLITRKEQFLRNGESLGVLNQDSIGKGSLEVIATNEFLTDGVAPGQNIATAGTQSTKNGRQLLVDVLDHGTISRYGIEVDEVTGQVRKLAIAEGDLVNAFQNVNKAMRFNETVMANVAVGSDENQVQQFLETASSPVWDTYKHSLIEMQTYTANLWNTMKSGGDVSQEELDYLMALSERVITLGKNVQKTSVDFKNFWTQNPEYVIPINFTIATDENTLSRDEQVGAEMEKIAQVQAATNNEKYDFVSFDNDTLKYKLTDIQGNVHIVTTEFNELYKQIAITSNRFIDTLDEVVGRVENLKNKFIDAENVGYLDVNDKDYKAFAKQLTDIDDAIAEGDTFENIDKMRQKAIALGEVVKRTVAKNKRLYTGTTEINAVERDYANMSAHNILDDEDLELVRQYNTEHQTLLDTYNSFKSAGTLYDPANQKELQAQAIKVKDLGRALKASVEEANTLQDLVDRSGTYKGKSIGNTKTLTNEEVGNLEASMKSYLKTLNLGSVENVKFDNVNQRLTGSLRLSNKAVVDLEMKYNDLTHSLYLYQKQERESLTGFPALIKGFKSKIGSILQYTASITSIYRVWGELRRGVQYIREIESALTELRKVTDETEETYDRFLNTAAKTADKVGSTIKDVVSSTADWARIGYSLQDAATLAESTAVLLNVSEFQSIDEATSALTSTLQAFGYTANQSMDVVDVMNEVGKLVAHR